MNFIMADVAGSTEVILGHPFLRQANALLDYGRREVTLFGEKVPQFNSAHHPEVHLVRVARTTVLESGCEYVVPGTARLRHAAKGDMMLSPTKSFIERNRVLVAYVVVQTRKSANIPIRVFNPGAAPVTLRRGAVAGVLQPATVLEKVELQTPRAPAASVPINTIPRLLTLSLLLYLFTCRPCSLTAAPRCVRLTVVDWPTCCSPTAMLSLRGPLI